MPWFRRRSEEPLPATRDDIARVEHVLTQLAERALRIQQDIAEVNGRLDRSEQGLSTYTYAVRSLSLRLVELDDKLAADSAQKEQAIEDVQGHLRAFELRLPKTRAHDPDDPERPATLEELEDVRLDARAARTQTTELVADLRTELARAMVELQALQARTAPPPPPPPGWKPPSDGTGWTAEHAAEWAGLTGETPVVPVDGAVESVTATQDEPTLATGDDTATGPAGDDADAVPATAEATGATPVEPDDIHLAPTAAIRIDADDEGEELLHDETAEIRRRDVA